MDFALTDEQEMLRETARRCSAGSARRRWCVPTPTTPRSCRRWWTVTSASGSRWVRVPSPTSVSSSRRPARCCCRVPTSPPPRSSSRSGAVDDLCGGRSRREATGTVALAGRSGIWEVAADPVRTFVPEVDGVDHVAIVLPGPAVAVVGADEVEARPIGTLDTTRRTFEIDVPDALDEAAVPVAPADLDRVLERATVALAAELVGVSRWLVDSTVAYVSEREQFGRPIGSFQGLQWRLVDTSLDHERATAAVYYAAMALDADDPDRRRAVHVAKAAAGTAARGAARTGLQLHGGIGYTWEHDLHLYLRRAHASDDLLGDATWHHDRLAELLFDADETEIA
ncbi:MAG: acyl-CoA dehydrogenase family protein [Acidimicrobiia bacterium]|nr:acyl-CoA dehydrogenase family protein [Acidimicrobiia bacterium]